MPAAPRTRESLTRSVEGGTAGRVLRRGVAWTLGGQWIGFIVQLLTIVVLARLLAPDDFGLVAMALAVTAIADQFRTLGLSQAVLQRASLTWTQMDGLFWINGVVGVLLAGVIAALGPVLAAFYGRTELVPISMALAAAYVINGFAVQHQALLSRQMRFAVLARRTVVARVLASMVAVTAALLGAGYWALVLQQIASVVFSAVVVWTAVRWLPGWPRQLRETWPLLQFGAGISVASLMNTVARQADNIIIGKALGAGALGLYTRAYSLLMLPIRQMKDPIGAVVVPVLATLLPEPQRYRRVYRSALAGVAHLGVPGVAVLAVVADPLILVMLGPQWSAAVPVFQLLAVAGLCQVASATTGWLFVSSGRSGAYAAWAAAASVATVLSFVVGVRWGIEGVAAAYAIGQLVLAGPSFVVACRGTPVILRDVVASLARPAVAAVLVGASALGARSIWTHSLVPGLDLVVSLVLSGVVWAAVICLWPGARSEIAQLLALRRAGRSPDVEGDRT